ncbi:MAG: 50S ribosomal protein L30e [Candidatus Marsarchaeota archaeon]|jgi:large subunit ribosomal protein L30e|nr:50S ribosomal protein L30e [Candidatus Marsarchaeota archaeon]MCL5418635.1 50S ribosomal protein L30e [Candidatus Marsarchaeota archaeon]
MADLSSGIRLAVDSGKVALGVRSVASSIKKGDAKLVIVASSSRKTDSEDIRHMAKIAGISIIEFKGNPMALGAVCGKPFSVSMLSIIDQGNSNIIEAAKESVS